MCAQNQCARSDELITGPDAPDCGKVPAILQLLASQISAAVRESDQAVDALTGSFTDIMQHVQTIQALVDNPAPAPQGNDDIAQQCTLISAKMQSAIIAFQFYDKLTQRLAHAASSTGIMAQLAQLPAAALDGQCWEEAEQRIRSSYTIEEDRRCFEAVISGQDPDTLVAPAAAQATAGESDIELF